jgi:hypothetical protein
LYPLCFGDPLDSGLLENRITGNRFDSPIRPRKRGGRAA